MCPKEKKNTIIHMHISLFGNCLFSAALCGAGQLDTAVAGRYLEVALAPSALTHVQSDPRSPNNLVTPRLTRPPITHPNHHVCASLAVQQCVEQHTVVVFYRRTGNGCRVGAVVALCVISLLLAAYCCCSVGFCCLFENQVALNSAR